MHYSAMLFHLTWICAEKMNAFVWIYVSVCVSEKESAKVVSFACSHANCSELMAKRNRDTCRLRKKWKFDFLIVNRTEAKRNVRSSVSRFFLLSSWFVLLCAISLNGLCHFYHIADDEERKRSHLISLIFAFFHQNFPIRFRCAMADG